MAPFSTRPTATGYGSMEYLDPEPSDATVLLVEALSGFFSRPATGLKIGGGISGAPLVADWSRPFTADRKLNGTTFRSYSVQVAEGFADSASYTARSRISSSSRCSPLTLPNSFLQNATAKQFPVLRALGPSKFDSQDAQEYPLQRPTMLPHAWQMNLKAINRPETSPQPFKAGATKPRLLERVPGGISREEDTFQKLGSTTPRTPVGKYPTKAVKASPLHPLIPITSPSAGGSSSGAKSFTPVAPTAQNPLASDTPIRHAGSSRKTISGELLLERRSPQNTEHHSGSHRATIIGGGPWPGLAKDHHSKSPRVREILKGIAARTSPIWKLHHKDDRDQRLHRLGICRRLKMNDSGPDGVSGYRNRVSRAEVEVAQESFLRYFTHKQGNFWDAEKILHALADFGIKAGTRSEKIQITAVLKEHEEDMECNFGLNQFFTLIEECRAKLRAARTGMVFQAWRRVDTEEAGFLNQKGVTSILEELMHGFKHNAPARLYGQVLTQDLNRDPVTGLISFHEVEYLVSAVKEFVAQTQRAQEREMKVRFGLDDYLYSKFQNQLGFLHMTFSAMGEEFVGYLTAEEITNILHHFGLLSSYGTPAHLEAAQVVLERYVSDETDSRVNFPTFLHAINSFRKLQRHNYEEEVRTLFNAYDSDKNGDLSMKEICSLLADMELQPNNTAEQEVIAQLIGEADATGNDKFGQEELLHLVQRVVERVCILHREEQMKQAEALRWTLKQTTSFRRAFEALDVNGEGHIPHVEVERVLSLLGWHISRVKFTRIAEELDTDGIGQVTFIEFLTLLRRIDDEIKSAGERLPEGDVPKGGQVAASQDTQSQGLEEPSNASKAKYKPHQKQNAVPQSPSKVKK